MDNEALAKAIARDIFSAGDGPRSTANRIQFMGGKWNSDEFPMGGYCEAALASRIQWSLEKNLSRCDERRPVVGDR